MCAPAAKRELWDALTLIGILSNEIIAQTLKHFIMEPRPASCAAVDFCSTYTMPSSHAQLATFAATVATLQLWRRRRAWRRSATPAPAAAATAAEEIADENTRSTDIVGVVLVGALWPLAAAVGMSRVYLGYHTRQQVVVGAIVGIAFGGVWHLVCCSIAAAAAPALRFSNARRSFMSRVARVTRLRDSSLVADPLWVERRALQLCIDAAAVAEKTE